MGECQMVKMEVEASAVSRQIVRVCDVIIPVVAALQ